jgi:hypothetical protein
MVGARCLFNAEARRSGEKRRVGELVRIGSTGDTNEERETGSIEKIVSLSFLRSSAPPR